MPGNPKRHALIAQIEAMPGGWDDIFAAIEDGATYRTLAEKFKVSRSFMHQVVTIDPERRKRAEAAYQVRAGALIDESIEIADNVDVMQPASAQKAKLQVELRKWLAAVDNARYRAADAKVNVNVTIGSLHLDALRRRQVQSSLAAGPADTPNSETPLVAPPVVDAELLEEGEAHE